MGLQGDMAAYVRTLVRGDFDANDRHEQSLDEGGWDGWPRYLGAVFFLAVDRRFRDCRDFGDVIRFVADLRAEAGEDGPRIDPSDAETLIAAVLAPADDVDIDPEMSGRIQMMVSYKILVEDELSDAELDALLDEAGRIAVG